MTLLAKTSLSILGRRGLLRGGALAAGAALPLLPAVARAADPDAPAAPAASGLALQGAGFYRFTLGTKVLTVLSDGASLFPAAAFARNEDPERLKEIQRADFRDPEVVRFHLNTLLVQEGDRSILIDAGFGSFFPGEGFGRLGLALAHAGVDPAAIDTVIVTHGHPDHYAGLVDAGLQPRFPKARIVWAEREWRYSTSPDAVADLGRTVMPAAFQALFGDLLQRVLPRLEATGRLDLVAEDAEIAPGIRLLPAPGHTPHSVVVRVESGDQALLFASDTTVLPELHARHPEHVTVFELDAEGVVATRRRLLDQAAVERSLWLGTHAQFPGLTRIRASGRAWESVPVEWSWAG